MITLKDLENRVYNNKICMQFDYIIRNGKDDFIRATFKRNKDRINEWVMQIVMDRTRDKDSEVYNFGYIMPRSNLPLELIAATGLKYFQLHIQEEVQQKSNLDFTIGEIIRGM